MFLLCVVVVAVVLILPLPLDSGKYCLGPQSLIGLEGCMETSDIKNIKIIIHKLVH